MEIRYPAQINIKVSKKIKDWVSSPQSENIRKILEWLHESYPNDFNKMLELIIHGKR